MTNRMQSLAAVAAAMCLLSGCNDKGSTATVTTAAPGVPAAPAAPATAAAPASTPPVAKTFDCGSTGQKPCPMQGWMKTVMTEASSSSDPEKLVKALTYTADHAPPGYADWSAIAQKGAEKAKAGDVDAAKASCRKCHDTYKASYQATMRDRAF